MNIFIIKKIPYYIGDATIKNRKFIDGVFITYDAENKLYNYRKISNSKTVTNKKVSKNELLKLIKTNN